jgi:hypothetical protein
MKTSISPTTAHKKCASTSNARCASISPTFSRSSPGASFDAETLRQNGTGPPASHDRVPEWRFFPWGDGDARNGDGPAGYANGLLTFDVELTRAGTWHACLTYNLLDREECFPAPESCMDAVGDRSENSRRLAARRDAVL